MHDMFRLPQVEASRASVEEKEAAVAAQRDELDAAAQGAKRSAADDRAQMQAMQAEFR